MTRQHNQPSHTTAWEDQRTAMLGTCNGKPLSPGSAPILHANQPIECPVCKQFIVLRWKVSIAQMTEAEVEKLQEQRGL